ncbi:MAG: hypothetical protein RL456_3078 [Pseudomonadota bacterium]|jgi:dTMP kinase
MTESFPQAASPAGRLITTEGIDGAGKSTQIERLAARWRGRGLEVVCTREPGGTALAEALRGLLLHHAMDALTEALVVFAARRDHLRQVIEPALARGAVVLCDRYTDATYAYQAGGRGLDAAVLDALAGWVQQGREPDLTFWFDLPPEEAARRRAAARAADRFEREDLVFFEQVRQGYATRFGRASAAARVVRLDATAAPDAVAGQIGSALEARGW